MGIGASSWKIRQFNECSKKEMKWRKLRLFLCCDADELIAAKIKDSSCDLLVMGAYGHSRIRRLILGSTTTELIRTCQVPVLLFR